MVATDDFRGAEKIPVLRMAGPAHIDSERAGDREHDDPGREHPQALAGLTGGRHRREQHDDRRDERQPLAERYREQNDHADKAAEDERETPLAPARRHRAGHTEEGEAKPGRGGQDREEQRPVFEEGGEILGRVTRLRGGRGIGEIEPECDKRDRNAPTIRQRVEPSEMERSDRSGRPLRGASAEQRRNQKQVVDEKRAENLVVIDIGEARERPEQHRQGIVTE